MLDSIIRDWLETLSPVPLEAPVKASGMTVDISMGAYPKVQGIGFSSYYFFPWTKHVKRKQNKHQVISSRRRG